jgi:hypothetical protein
MSASPVKKIFFADRKLQLCLLATSNVKDAPHRLFQSSKI